MTELDHHRPRRSSLLLILLSLLAATTAQAQGKPGSDYLRDIKPVLKDRCFACHGALKQESDLRLDTVVAMREHDIMRIDELRRASAACATCADEGGEEGGELVGAGGVATAPRDAAGPSPADPLPSAAREELEKLARALDGKKRKK